MGSRPEPPGGMDDDPQPGSQAPHELVRLVGKVAFIVVDVAASLIAIYLAIKGGGPTC